jgi:hypothetical protein
MVLEGSQLVVLGRAIILELKYQPLDHTNHRQGNIPYCQNYNPKVFEGDEHPETCSENLERLICKHNLLTKE